MPLYEYLCEACGRRTEALQRLDEPPLTVCPHCEGKLRKLLSAPAFQFKGSGWYLTDYARKSGGGDTSAGSGDSGSAGASSDSSAGASKSATGGSGESSAPAKPAAKAGDD
jgi:putative FmdB family regulatory protein